MGIEVRSKKTLELEIDGDTYEVEVLEIPFREGVELKCVVSGEEIRVSDRGLGDHEALRLLEVEVRRFLESGQ